METHQAVLEKIVPRSAGPILELGVGEGSTPLLHRLRGQRSLLSADDDGTWLARFAHLAGDGHVFVRVRDWSEVENFGLRYGVALVDLSPGGERAPVVERLRGGVDYIVVHDTELTSAHLYPGLAEVLATFPHRADFGPHPRTTVVSMTKEIPA